MAHNQKGFTIVETMIAVATFSLIASIATIVAVQLSRSYQLGITKSKLDNAARNIYTQFEQTVQYSNSFISQTPNTSIYLNGQTTYAYSGLSGNWNTWCGGTNRFSWQEPTGNVLPNSGANIYEDTLTQASSCLTAPFNTSSAKKLNPSGSFVSKFLVTGSTSPYKLRLVLAAGDKTMYVNQTITTDLSSTPNSFPQCYPLSLGNFSFCAVVYYDGSASQMVN
jgi:prepilin-type N-terminal cleavage/methylation domain-containing protein